MSTEERLIAYVLNKLEALVIRGRESTLGDYLIGFNSMYSELSTVLKILKNCPSYDHEKIIKSVCADSTEVPDA